MKTIQTIGIIGAGKLGTVLAQIALNVGLDVYISGSGSPDRIKLVIDTLAPGAIATTTKDAVQHADDPESQQNLPESVGRARRCSCCSAQA